MKKLTYNPSAYWTDSQPTTHKIIIFLLLVVGYLLLVSSVHAVTKPLPNANLNSYSYVFYLYYDNGQLFGDRDYEVKYDILNEAFVPQVVALGAYKLEILNSKAEVVEMVQFDPRQGNPAFTVGKIIVKAPYDPSGQRVLFYNDQGAQLVNIFIFEGALCNDDGSCSLGQGENENTCPGDCIKTAATPVPTVSSAPVNEGFDILTLAIYGIGGVLVVAGAWFGWKWWQKRKEESFLPPPSSPSGPAPLESESAVPPPTSLTQQEPAVPPASGGQQPPPPPPSNLPPFR